MFRLFWDSKTHNNTEVTMAKILVVDDERVLVKGIKFNLENEGYEVQTGSNGEEAVMGGGGSRRYDWETKVAAARDHVENGLTKTEAMARHGIASIAYLKAKVAYLEKLRALRASKSRGASEAPSSDCSQGGDTGSTTS